jgi:WD40 repeat protein
MLLANTVLQGRYKVLAPVGQGGMGAVYRAADLRLRNEVALKETLFTDAAYRSAFEREAQILARLRHAALPRVIDHFSEGNGQFLVMEFIHGEDLEGRLRRLGRRFTSAEALPWILRWADQLLDVLTYLHTRPVPIVHHDIKPKNLKLSASYDVILLDFGLARGGLTYVSHHNPGDETVTPHRKVYGFTPPYAPIEQMREEESDPRSDLYSLAATLYHLLSGQLPTDAMTRMSRMFNQQPDPLRPIHEIAPHVPVAIESWLQRSLALTVEGRHSSAREMRSELQELRSQMPLRPGAEPRPRLPVERPSDEVIASPQAVTAPLAQARIGVPVALTPLASSTVSGSVLRTFNLGSEAKALVFSHDGKQLAVGCADRTIGVYQLGQNGSERILKGHTSSVRSLRFSKDDSLLISASDDETVRLWQTDEWRSLRYLRVPGCSIECIALNHSGDLLAVGGWGTAITLCKLVNAQIDVVDMLPSSFIQALAFSPDDATLASGCYDGSVALWNTKDCHHYGTLSGHSSFVLSLAYSPDSLWLAASGGSQIRLWQPSDPRKTELLSGHRSPVRDLAFSPDGRLLATGSEDHSVRLWQTEDWSPTSFNLSHSAGVTCLAFSPDGQLLAAGGHDGKVRLWHL